MNYPPESPKSSTGDGIEGFINRTLSSASNLLQSATNAVSTDGPTQTRRSSSSSRSRPLTPDRVGSHKSNRGHTPITPITPTLEATSASGGYEGDRLGNARHGKGKQTYPNGDVYDGQWKNNKRHGEGVYQFKETGIKYDGSFFEDKRTGKATCTFPNGSVYEGDFVDGLMHGQGELRTKEGCVYVGSWVKGVKKGSGVCTNRNGDRLEGTWENDSLNNGTINYADGSVYVGGLKDYLKHGQGRFTWNKGEKHLGKYVGEYHEDHRHKGELHYADGTMYDGGFLDGLPSGQGTATYPDGTKYNGSFLRGLRHGQGTVHHSDGVVNEGEWVDGKLKPKDGLSSSSANLAVLPRNVHMTVISASELRKGDVLGKNDTFVEVTIGQNTQVTTTKTDSGDQASWNELLVFDNVPLSVKSALVNVMDEDQFKINDLLGFAEIKLTEGLHTVTLSNSGKEKGKLTFSIEFR